MRARRTRVGWTAALITALALAGCTNSGEPEPSAEPTPTATTATPEPTPTPTPTPEPVLWPLTGLEAPQAPTTPALAIKVENSIQARPQTGLEDADVVWEEMVEGGITRYNAVYHSRLPETVGPIRSVRPMDAGIVAPLGGPQVISGGQQLFLRELQDAGVQLISHDRGHAGYARSSQRRAPHNLYGTPEVFLEQAQHTDPPSRQFEFARDVEGATAVEDGEVTSQLRLGFPSAAPGWTWDEDGDVWLRDESGTPAVTAEGEQLTATNVVVLRVQIVASAGRDQSGNAVPETVLTGGGQALVAAGGRTLEVVWDKETLTDPVSLRTTQGRPVYLAPGRTWVELVPADRGSVTTIP